METYKVECVVIIEVAAKGEYHAEEQAVEILNAGEYEWKTKDVIATVEK